MIVGDIIFRNIGDNYKSLRIEVKVGYLRIVVYGEDGWICPVRNKVTSYILGLIRDLCEILEGREIFNNEEQDLIGVLKVRNRGKDLSLLNSVYLDVGWVKKEIKS